MAYDPIEPDAIEDIEDLEADAVQERDVEAPEVDAAEQHADIAPDRDDPLTGMDPDRANVADLVEQARVVALDEDDYR
ncbi:MULTISPECIES: hypothetical protein [Streptomyces]|uniref:DUF5709 domain-containing protein n=2 Tax=Streptomyces TaxID=1883 RepID=A0ABS9JQX3_9ACTN|nr:MULTISPECIES: hypothetical protein [Streptomyces]MYU29869.1 hypothetical protein [Streptomyces sp. SID7810]CUW30928.1 hypothetical protein TUE45_05663 [Streptomyces reticuli]AKN72066.1 hypothetical protein QR97_21785 [Streptomyces sp. PBH53]MCG0067952.1 hypothetical protein [Streptomyces tricolor]OYP15516.1 hypothetical protein CFC35_14240 [Streptomyces sp. FBKL.4005]